MFKKAAENLFIRNVKGTLPGALVAVTEQLIARLTKKVGAVLKTADGAAKVYLSSRVIKHLYDKRTAQEFEVILKCAHLIVRLPNAIYENKDGKRGDFIFVKQIQGAQYVVILEKQATTSGEIYFSVVTAFRVRKTGYLENHRLLWTWRGDIPSS